MGRINLYSTILLSVFFVSGCSSNIPQVDQFDFETSESIIETDGVLHSVDLDDILAGGPPMDGIPSIDEPKFTTVEEADELLDDDGIGVAISYNGVERFYPFQILVYHEIVNDMIDEQGFLITYCPLCGSGIVFNPVVNNEISEFGTSGKLWNSNLVMYDRQTESYWSQILGEAIVGEMTGTTLELLPYQNMLWSNWKELYPDGEVLSSDTGYSRNYSFSPYGDYDSNTAIYFPVDYEDDRYHEKSPIYGIYINGIYKAYPIEELEANEENIFTDEVMGVQIGIEYDPETGNIFFTRYDTNTDVIPFYSFWFSWVAAHPDTEVFTHLNQSSTSSS